MSETRHVTIYDIAERCGVSAATVSRVLSNSDYPVRKETRERVEKAAEEMRYTPNLLGKNLKTRVCKDIGVIIPNFSNYVYSTLLQGVYPAAEYGGYNIILCNSYRDPRVELANVELLLQKQVSGILIVSISPDQLPILRAMSYGVRVVAVEQSVNVPCGRVELDFFRGGWLAAEHLLSLGHRRIGFIGAPLNRPSRQQTLDGFRACLRSAGFEPDEDLVMLSGGPAESDRGKVYEFSNGRMVANAFCDMPDPPTACVALNDMTALAAMRQFQERGLRIPEDMSIVGFDNLPFCETSSPGLTTLEKHAEEIGHLAADMLIGGIESPSRPYTTLSLKPDLILRGSTAPPRPSGARAQ